MDENFSRQLHDAVARQASVETFERVEPLLHDLWSQRELQLAREARFPSAEGLGVVYVQHAQPASAAVAQVLLAGRVMVELAEGANLLDAAGARRLQMLVDEAAVQVAAAVEKARRTRRGQWLSYLAHELKNPLNTILNALWLLRERGNDKRTASRFVDLAERAVKRIEARITDMRALDEQLLAAPPGWDALHAPALAEEEKTP